MEPSLIKFSAYQQPALPIGEYNISLTQRLIRAPFTISPDLLAKPNNPNGPAPGLDQGIKDKLKGITAAFSSEEDFFNALKKVLTAVEFDRCRDIVFNYVAEVLISPTVERTFYIAGQRFAIPPAEIGTAFPPAYSLGEQANVFPHITILRSTLPWERRTSPADNNTPWLALLVIYEEEEVNTKSTIENLGNITKLLNITQPLEPGQTDNDSIQVIHVKKDFLEKILPGKNDLRWLTHVRQTLDNAGKPTGTDMAVIIANRLPKKGGVSTVYLVSLENRYMEGEQGAFNYANADAAGMICLVQLNKWSFTSTEHFKISSNFLDKANDLDPAIKDKLKKILGREYFTEKNFFNSLQNDALLTPAELDTNKARLIKDFSFGDFANILKHLDRNPSTLRLPDTRVPAADKSLSYLKMGFYPLPHKLRQGGQTVSWYHGPLSTTAVSQALNVPVTASDSLLHYYKDNGLFDVSYAAAWELGRLLALQNSSFSTALYQWKKQYVRSTRKAMQMRATPHLQGANRDYAPISLPDSLSRWLRDLALLQGVPFNYLVPDQELLPIESLRFFRLDKAWIHALLDGALSIGRISSKDLALDKQMMAAEDSFGNRDVTGFILRSEVVAGWPDLQIEAYNTKLADNGTPAAGSRLDLLRDETLSANVRVCLFEGDLKALSLHLKPEQLHFGVDGDPVAGFTKRWRDENTGEEDDHRLIKIPVDTDTKPGVVDMTTLIANYTAVSANVSSSAHLAIQLLEGVERVCFEL